ncbi:hypothetical protein FHG87_013616 [Trinorchestia longiramus]|nr:hypothetical protein FHG87_013616 [Trinorchestia longiramus]
MSSKFCTFKTRVPDDMCNSPNTEQSIIGTDKAARRGAARDKEARSDAAVTIISSGSEVSDGIRDYATDIQTENDFTEQASSSVDSVRKIIRDTTASMNAGRITDTADLDDIGSLDDLMKDVTATLDTVDDTITVAQNSWTKEPSTRSDISKSDPDITKITTVIQQQLVSSEENNFGEATHITPTISYTQSLYDLGNESRYYLTNDQPHHVTNEQQHHLNNEQSHHLTNEQPHHLTSEQQHHLTNDQPHHLTNEQQLHLTNEQSHHLTNEQQHHLTSEQQHHLTNEQQHHLTSEQPYYSNNEQLHDMTSEPSHDFINKQPYKLTNEKLHYLTSEQPHHLASEKPHHLNNDQPHHLTSGKPYHLAGEKSHHLNNDQPHHLISEKSHHLNNDQPHHLTSEKSHHLNNDQPHHLTGVEYDSMEQSKKATLQEVASDTDASQMAYDKQNLNELWSEKTIQLDPVIESTYNIRPAEDHSIYEVKFDDDQPSYDLGTVTMTFKYDSSGENDESLADEEIHDPELNVTPLKYTTTMKSKLLDILLTDENDALQPSDENLSGKTPYNWGTGDALSSYDMETLEASHNHSPFTMTS